MPMENRYNQIVPAVVCVVMESFIVYNNPVLPVDQPAMYSVTYIIEPLIRIISTLKEIVNMFSLHLVGLMSLLFFLEMV